MKKISNKQIFNTTRLACGENFQSRLNEATNENIQNMMNNIYTNSSYKAEFNEFLETLINKVAFTIFRQTKIDNIYSRFIYYNVSLGDIIEEIAVRPAEAENYETGYDDVTGNYDGVNFARVTKPKVDAVYYSGHNDRKYRVTVYEDQIARAFTNEYGLSGLVGEIINSLSQGANLDEYYLFKEVLNAFITKEIKEMPKKATQVITLANNISSVDTAKEYIFKVKNILAKLTKPTCKFNAGGRITQQRLADMTMFLRDDISNFLSVEVLASAFHRENLNLNPEGVDTGGTIKISTIDDFGGLLPTIKDGTAGYKLLYSVYDTHGKFKHYSETDGGDATTKDVYMLPNYRFKTLPTYTAPQKVELNIVAIVISDDLPVIAIEREHWGSNYISEGMYLNNHLIRIRKYGFSPLVNGIIIYEPNTDVSIDCIL